jgi:hypothetical protein
MEDFKKLPKMQSFKVGGKVSKKFTAAMEKEFPKGATITPAQDEAEDKKMVKKAVGQHESALHEGEPKTKLKLKTGGRTKKEVGTVQKYCGGSSVKSYCGGKSVKKYNGADGSYVTSDKTPDQIVAEDTRIGNQGDRELVAAPLRAAKNYVKDKVQSMFGTKPTEAEIKKATTPSAPVAKKRGGRCK